MNSGRLFTTQMPFGGLFVPHLTVSIGAEANIRVLITVAASHHMAYVKEVRCQVHNPLEQVPEGAKCFCMLDWSVLHMGSWTVFNKCMN